MQEKEERPARAVAFAAVAASALWAAGCAIAPTDSGKAPVQEMSDARQAIKAARVAGSPHYSPESFQKAQSLMEQAMRSLYQGEYRAAKRAALSARARAIAAREAALAAQRME
ncbi:MAG: DUF4398 domain-containing protein [Nitrococcus sp.]|nr:DUF4398 domain-containing protein [Nitrococcus sp.]